MKTNSHPPVIRHDISSLSDYQKRLITLIGVFEPTLPLEKQRKTLEEIKTSLVNALEKLTPIEFCQCLELVLTHKELINTLTEETIQYHFGKRLLNLLLDSLPRLYTPKTIDRLSNLEKQVFIIDRLFQCLRYLPPCDELNSQLGRIARTKNDFTEINNHLKELLPSLQGKSFNNDPLIKSLKTALKKVKKQHLFIKCWLADVELSNKKLKKSEDSRNVAIKHLKLLFCYTKTFPKHAEQFLKPPRDTSSYRRCSTSFSSATESDYSQGDIHTSFSSASSGAPSEIDELSDDEKIARLIKLPPKNHHYVPSTRQGYNVPCPFRAD